MPSGTETTPSSEGQIELDTPGSNPSRFDIVFDGGSLGNPGKGYGSYEITQNGRIIRRQREEYGNGVTNNQAEYLTLIHALQWLAESIGADASRTRVLVNGDSQLVLNQLLGRWKVKNEGLRALYTQAAHLVNRFERVDLVWHSRARSVERLGH